MKFELKSLDDTTSIAKKIAEILESGDVVFLEGDLGTGKTTFVNEIAKIYGTLAKSPTFSLVNLYDGEKKISHIDLYRLETIDDAYNIGIEEILDDDTIKFVEWPEILGDEPFDLKLTFKYEDGKRVLYLDGDALKRGDF